MCPHTIYSKSHSTPKLLSKGSINMESIREWNKGRKGIFHHRHRGFSQIRGRKEEATGNCFVHTNPKGLMARNQHKKIIKKLL